eukprot:4509824-Amphidinium_carterae.1
MYSPRPKVRGGPRSLQVNCSRGYSSLVKAQNGEREQNEQDDIEHRDRCQQQGGKNKNEIEDLDSSLDKTSGHSCPKRLNKVCFMWAGRHPLSSVAE